MATEVLVGLIGFGTAVVGLATAYLSRTRHVIHRHDPSELGEPHHAVAVESEEGESERDTSSRSEGADVPPTAGGNKYGRAAVRAVELCRTEARMTPPEAWDVATSEMFGAGTPAQCKGCPKSAFLGLCQAGLVVDVPRGDYCRGEKNMGYAVAAAKILGREPALASNLADLWRRSIAGAVKRHNSQMNVVVALWCAGLLRTTERVEA